MTLDANVHGDLLQILGRNGVTVVESSPDTLYIDVDLLTNSGMEVVSNELKMKVDGSTVAINGSGQLTASPTGPTTLASLTDVSYGLGEPSNQQVLFYDGTRWTSGSVSLSNGYTATTGNTWYVATSLNPSSSSVAGSGHDHVTGTASAAMDNHTHTFPGLSDGFPDPTTTWLSKLGTPKTAAYSMGSASSFFNAYTDANEVTTSVRGGSHTHARNTLSVSIV